MGDIFRVCIMGRYYDIPTSEISNATLQSLKSLVDESSSINPRDLLRSFLEYAEINCVLKSEILAANQKLEKMQTQKIYNQTQQVASIPQAQEAEKEKESDDNIGSLGEGEIMAAQLEPLNDNLNQVKSS